jgi:D-aminoacyl-tRNA deacylase
MWCKLESANLQRSLSVETKNGVVSVIALLQRVAEAKVVVDGAVVGVIGSGLLVLLCAEKGDNEVSMRLLLDKLFSYRVFSDANGKMNLSLKDVGGGLLLVPQFTLAADTNSGTRPSFTPAASPDVAKKLFDQAVTYATVLAEKWAAQAINMQKTLEITIAKGVFGADMKVHLINDGPVTFWLQTKA